MFNHVAMVEGLTGMSMRVFTKILGWSVEEMELLLSQVRAEMRRRYIHSYLPMYGLSTTSRAAARLTMRQVYCLRPETTCMISTFVERFGREIRLFLR